MPEEFGALTRLGQMMSRLGPPSLSILISRVMEGETYEEFIKVIRDILPEREADILAGSTPDAQIATFASYFNDRYFPIQDMADLDENVSYGEIMRGIPVVVRGVSWEEYHIIASDYSLGCQIMTYIAECPYDDDQEGARVALADSLSTSLTPKLIKMVPEGGIPLEQLNKLLKGTRYNGVLLWSQYMHQNTGNAFMDVDDEMYGYSQLPEWDKEEVEALTTEWQQAERIEQEISGMRDWLEEAPKKHFKELMDFILKQEGEEVNGKRRSKQLPVGSS